MTDLQLLVTNETDQVACSLYETQFGLKIWLRVGVGIIEIKHEHFEDVVEVLLETLADIENITGVVQDEEA